MKLKNIKKYSNKLLKFKIIQNKVYNKKQHLNNIKIEDIEYRLKKIFNIIYKYHIFDKKILFVGPELSSIENFQIKFLLKSTKHVFIPTNFWVRGAISNNKTYFKHSTKNRKSLDNKISKLLFQLKNKVDLIVLLDESNSLNVSSEGYESRIPIISLNSYLNIHHNKSSYRVPGNFQFNNKKILDNFFYSLLISTLKKGNRHKHSLNLKKSRSSRTVKKLTTNNFKNKYYRKKKIKNHV